MRTSLVEAAIRVSVMSVAWALGVGSGATISGIAAGSAALVGFGLNSVIDGSASAVLVWRFRVERTNPDRAERVENVAGRLIAVSLLIVAAYLTVRAFQSLGAQMGPGEAGIGLYLAGGSLFVLPVLAVRKLRLASQLKSRALRGDGVLSAAGGLLALIALLALVVNRAFGWWWSDAVGSLVIAGVVAGEGLRSLLHLRS